MLSSFVKPVLHLTLLTTLVSAFPAVNKVDPKTNNSTKSQSPKRPSQPKYPFKWDVPALKPAKAKAPNGVLVTTESTTDCNEFPDIGYGGSDAPIYKFWPMSTPLNVTCYIDVVISDQNYTFLRTTDLKGKNGCWVDEMNIIEPPKPENSSIPSNSTILPPISPIEKAPPRSPPMVLKPVVDGDGPINEDDFPDADDDDDEESEEEKRKKKHNGIELSDVLPECPRPRPYQIWTTRNEYLLPKDGFFMNCYQKPTKSSKKYEVQWGARHVWCWKDGEAVEGNKKWWRDAHVIDDGKKSTGFTQGTGFIQNLMRWAKPEEHCWVPADALDGMVFQMDGAGGRCRDNEH